MYISIIIPLFHGKKYISILLDNIQENIEYAKRYFLCSIEVIFVNDCEDDIRGMDLTAWPMPIHILANGKNMGIHFSRIQGLKAAEGKYILFLDQDDHIDKRFIYSQLSKVGEADVIICNGIYRNNRLIMQDKREGVEEQEYFFLAMNMIISPGQALIKKDMIPGDWTKYILRGNYCDDAFLWLLMKNEGAEFKINSEVLYYHNENDNNTSFLWEQNAIALKEMYDIIVRNRLFKEEQILKIKEYIECKITKHTQYARIESLFVNLKAIQVEEYARKKGYNTIAVYGYGVFGKKFIDFMQNTKIEIAYTIDENAKAFTESNMDLFSMEDELEAVDVVIVSAVFAFDEIKKKLLKKINCEIIALDSFLGESINYVVV